MLRWVWVVLWSVLTLWMLTYSMYISFVYAVFMLWCFIPNEKKRTKKLVVILGLSPFIIWNVGFVEYGLKTIDLHCRVLGYTGQSKSSFCSYAPEYYSTGLNHSDGALFSTVEHIGVHGFNGLLAAGGAITALPEVAWETLFMSFSEDPTPNGMVNESKSTRVNQCKGGSKALKKSISRGSGDWMFKSRKIRTMVGQNVPKAKKVVQGKPKKFKSKRVVYSSSTGATSNNDYYGELLRTDNIRVPLSLVVSDGTLHQEARISPTGPILDVTWTGTISYPASAHFLFPIPTIYQTSHLRGFTGQTSPFPLILSEGIFCGMTIDGAMNPYTQKWTTTLSVNDPRISTEGQLQSEQGWIEMVLRGLLK